MRTPDVIRVTKKNAWLISWDASTEDRLAHIKGPKVLAFIDSRRSRMAVREMIFAIYLSANDLSPEEKLSFAFSPERRRAMQMEDFTTMRCGFNPWVVARQVENVQIETKSDGTRIVSWRHPVYSHVDGMPQLSHYYLSEEIIQR